MKQEEIFTTLDTLIKNITQNDDLKITNETKFNNIPNWDSLNTVDLEIEVEAEYNIDFEAGEFQNYKSVEELVDAIVHKLK